MGIGLQALEEHRVGRPSLEALVLAILLTIVAMAALGLGVDLKALSRVGGRVTLAVTLPLLMLMGIGLGPIRLLGVA